MTNELPIFVKWLDDPEVIPTELDTVYDVWRRDMRSGIPAGQAMEEFNQIMQGVMDSGHALVRQIHEDGFVKLSGRNRNSTNVHSLLVSNNDQGISLSTLRIRTLRLQGNNSLHSPTDISGCWIDKIEIYHVGKIVIENCWIGTLDCHGGEITDLSIRGGGILSIISRAAHENNPFKGSIHFKKVYLPRQPGGRLVDAQPYRNMRAHMIKLENTPMVSLFHTLEQAVERIQTENYFDKSVSWLYEQLSDYGSSIRRPAAWFFGLFLTTLVVVTCLGGAVAVSTGSHGWYGGLDHTSHWHAVERVVLLTLQGTLNPLGLFGSNSVIIPANGKVAAWMIAHSICSTIFAALFVLALRRRFKMA
jgi:hypothetical protein